MMGKKYCILLILCCLFMPGIPVFTEEPVITLRSGTINNDDVAEALSSAAKEYKPFLVTSNMIVKRLEKKAYGTVYRKNLHPELAQLISSEKFAALNEKIVFDLGPIEIFKPMQWYFVRLKEEGKDILISVKIVYHRAAVVYYKLTFYPDNPKGIIGFHYNVKHLRVKVKS